MVAQMLNNNATLGGLKFTRIRGGQVSARQLSACSQNYTPEGMFDDQVLVKDFFVSVDLGQTPALHRDFMNWLPQFMGLDAHDPQDAEAVFDQFYYTNFRLLTWKEHVVAVCGSTKSANPLTIATGLVAPRGARLIERKLDYGSPGASGRRLVLEELPFRLCNVGTPVAAMGIAYYLGTMYPNLEIRKLTLPEAVLLLNQDSSVVESLGLSSDGHINILTGDDTNAARRSLASSGAFCDLLAFSVPPVERS